MRFKYARGQLYYPSHFNESYFQAEECYSFKLCADNIENDVQSGRIYVHFMFLVD